MTTPADFSIPPLQLRRGTDTAIMAYQAAEGEPIYNVDTKEMRIGDGSTPGGISILGSSGTYIFNVITATNATFNNITVNQTATISKLNLTGISNATTPLVLYYNTSTKEISYALALSGGGTGTFTSTNIVASTGSFNTIEVRDTIQLGDYNPSDNTSRILFQYTTGSQGISVTNAPAYSGGIGYNAIRIGNFTNAGDNSTTVGHQAQQGVGASDTVAIGYRAGKGLLNGSQNNNTIIGNIVTNNVPAQSAVAMTDTLLMAAGPDTTVNQRLRVGPDRIIVGKNGFDASVAANSIILNASGSTMTSANSGLFVNPITNSTSTQVLYYNTSTKEVTWGSAPASGSSYNQSLNTTDNTLFKSTKSTQVVSAGGYPVDSNGQALIYNANTQSMAMVVSNYTSGLLPWIGVRGWGQNRPGTVTTSTSAAPGMRFENARGSTSTPYASQSGDNLMVIQAGGWDGTRWSSDVALYPFQLTGQATETMIGNATTVSNAGTRFILGVQPQGVQLNATSVQQLIYTGWTAPTTSTPPRAFLNFGNATANTPTLIHSNGTSTFTGWGSTDVQFINTKNFIYGVPGEDTSPDNTTMTATNYLMFATGRRSGVSGRRNALVAGDTIGSLLFYGQTASSATSIGSLGGQIYYKALDSFTGSARGTQFIVQTANSGTTTVQNRLQLDSETNTYSSKSHNFTTPGNASTIAILNTSSSSIASDTLNINNASGTSIASFTTASIAVTAPIDVTGLSRSTGGAVSGMNAGSTTYTIFTFNPSAYSGAKLVCKIKDSADLHMVEMMVISDGTNTTYNEYAVVTNNGDLGTFDATVSGGQVLVRFTTKSGISNANAKVNAILLA